MKWWFLVKKKSKHKFKTCVAFFMFSQNGSPSKTMKNAFCFILKILFILEIFKFSLFFLSFPHFPNSKEQMKVEFMMSWIGLHKVAAVISGITQGAFYHQAWTGNTSLIFLILFCNLKSDWSLVSGFFCFSCFPLKRAWGQKLNTASLA